MKSKQCVTMMITGVLMVTILLGCTSQVATPSAERKTTVPVLSGKFGTTSYAIAHGWVDTLNKNFPETKGFRFSAQETPGGEIAINMVNDMNVEVRKVVIFHYAQPQYFQVSQGKYPTSLKYTPLSIAATSATTDVWVTLDPKIRRIPEDLIGKRFALQELTHGDAKVEEHVLKMWGIWDKVSITRMNWADGHAALRDGKVDVIPSNVHVAEPLFRSRSQLEELLAVKGKSVYVFGIGADGVKKLAASSGEPWTGVEVPGGSIPHQPEPFFTHLVIQQSMACTNTADEEYVYTIIKTIGERIELVSRFHSEAFKDKKKMFTMLPVTDPKSEIHPGALRYYREIGVYNPK